MLAVAESMRIQQCEKIHDPDADIDSSELHLFSVGTGHAQFSLAPPGADAGLICWASRIADVMGTAQTQGIHLPLKFKLGDRYRHVNFKMTEKWALDAVENIPKLFKVGEQRAAETYDLINEEFFQHTRKPFKPFSEDDMEIKLDEFGFE